MTSAWLSPASSPDGVQTLTVARPEIVVVVAAEHPWARRRTIAARDLIAEPYLAKRVQPDAQDRLALLLSC